MKTGKLIDEVLDFFNLKKKKQKKEINRLEDLRESLKEKRKDITQKLKNCDRREKDRCMAELKAIENLRHKTKDAIKKLK